MRRRTKHVGADVRNVVIAGVGGQGTIKASDILADVAMRAGCDVKKAEIHGMSQRGGSVSSDIRFGSKVLSPMVPTGRAEFLVVMNEDEVSHNMRRLRDDGLLITPKDIDVDALTNKLSLNIALLGVLSAHLPFDRSLWLDAIRSTLADRLHEANEHAFAIGRSAAEQAISSEPRPG